MAQPNKKGPRRRNRRQPHIHVAWRYCEHCHTHTTTYANFQSAFRAGLNFFDKLCINSTGGIHLAIP
jgi:hypothetical protein